MSNLVLPSFSNIRIHVSRTLETDTARYPADSGLVDRFSRWSFPHYRYVMRFNVLRTAAALAEYQTLVGFFAQVMGGADTFLIQDPADYTQTAMPFGVGDGSTKDFQLQRTLVPSASIPAAASRHYWPLYDHGYEPIFDLQATPTVYDNGSTVGSGLSVGQYQSGVATFTNAPTNGHVLTWTGTYYRRVVFAEDKLETLRVVNGTWAATSVELESAVQ